jgi:hypothetical protein
MTHQITKVYYWTVLFVSICALFLSFGIGIMALGIIILPIIIYNIKIGVNLDFLHDKQITVFLASSNWLGFTLLRPDGVHTINKNGISSLLDVIDINGGYNSQYENYYFTFSLIMLALQIVINYRLLKRIRLAKNKSI